MGSLQSYGNDLRQAVEDGLNLMMVKYAPMEGLIADPISNPPDPETAAKAILTTASGGAVSTETLQAFSEEEYRKIISELP